MQLIFRDFKTSNVLLDKDFNAKLSDFGLARQGPPEGLSHVSTSVSFSYSLGSKFKGYIIFLSSELFSFNEDGSE